MDTISKIHTKLDETKGVLTQTIDDMLTRGEKLDDLVQASSDLSDSSKRFATSAARTKPCCVMF